MTNKTKLTLSNEEKQEEWYKLNEDKFLNEYVDKYKDFIIEHIFKCCIKDVITDCPTLLQKFDDFVDKKWESH